MKTQSLIIACLLAITAFGQNVSTNDVVDEAEALCKSLESNPKDVELLKKLGLTAQKVSDLELKSRYLAIYSLGSTCAGNPQGAAAALEYLRRTNPSSGYISQLSKKNLSEPCSSCEGKGSISERCTKCNYGSCPACGGSGEKQGIGGSRLKCPACVGSGKCKICNGKGEVTAKCKQCAGEGSVFSMAKADGLYKSLLSKSSKEIPVSLTEQAKKSEAEKAKQEEVSVANKADAGEEEKRDEERKRKDEEWGKQLIKQREEREQAENKRTARLAEMKQQFATLKQKTPKTVDFKHVLVDPKKYDGQVLESTVYYAFADFAIGYETVNVQATINGKKVPIWLLEGEQRQKVNRVAGAVGEYGRVIIQYYVSADKEVEAYCLLDINPS